LGRVEHLGSRVFSGRRNESEEVDNGCQPLPSNIGKLHITNVLRKSFVEVSEAVTEAAAATAVVVGLGSARPLTLPYTPFFKAERPFFYLMRDRVTRSILFVGLSYAPLSFQYSSLFTS
jgi:hypothetical protein